MAKTNATYGILPLQTFTGDRS